MAGKSSDSSDLAVTAASAKGARSPARKAAKPAEPNLYDFPVLNRFSGAVQFTARISLAEGEPLGLRIAAAVRWAIGARANLSGADLSRADLSRADLSGANLSGADLSRADLSGANLSGANLSRADLSRANLSGADLSRADLSGANLSRADLSGANLSGADLSRADLSDQKIKRLAGSALRSDGYQFFAFELEEGGVKIKAGCRWMTPAEYRAHVKSYTSASKKAETLRIVKFLEEQAAGKPWS